MIRVLFIVVGLVLSGQMHAQETAEIHHLAIEWLLEESDVEEMDLSTLIADLDHYARHPIDLNRGSLADLSALPMLGDLQAQAIIDHRTTTGPLFSVLELQGVEALDGRTVRAIMPYVSVGGDGTPPLRWTDLWRQCEQELVIRNDRVLEPMAGYRIAEDVLDSGAYLGSPDRLFVRYSYRSSDRIAAGVTLEKDPGEVLYGPYGALPFDFRSSYLAYSGRKWIETWVVGDYQAQFGQGLTQWSGLAFGGMGVAGVKRNARGILPYRSADEHRFLRGSAISIRSGSWKWSGFYSDKRVDARIEGFGQDRSFVSVQRSGIHATFNQIEQRKTLRDRSIGMHLESQFTDRLKVGWTTVFQFYDIHQQTNETPYKALLPTEPFNLVSGVDYQWAVRNVMFFGEHSLRPSGGHAHLDGLLISLSRSAELSLVHRHYSPDYSVEHSNAVSAGSGVNNEHGIQWNLSTRLHRRWSLGTAVDLYVHPWLKYRVNAPSQGMRLMAQVDHRPDRDRLIQFRARWRSFERNERVDGDHAFRVQQLERFDARVAWSFPVSATLEARGRIEGVLFRRPSDQELGFVLYQDLIWKPAFPSRHRIKARFAVFDTDSYDARIYAYEFDVPYAFTSAVYAQRGSRWTLVWSYKAAKWFDLAVKVAQTYYSNRSEIGSGRDRIDLPRRTQLRVQCRFRL